jgi:hypothetical protein
VSDQISPPDGSAERPVIVLGDGWPGVVLGSPSASSGRIGGGRPDGVGAIWSGAAFGGACGRQTRATGGGVIADHPPPGRLDQTATGGAWCLDGPPGGLVFRVLFGRPSFSFLGCASSRRWPGRAGLARLGGCWVRRVWFCGPPASLLGDLSAGASRPRRQLAFLLGGWP